MTEITLPFTREKAISLKCGDSVKISGVIYTGRDSAHKRLTEMLERGEKPPFDLMDAIIYYVGPCPHAEGKIIGSCGPTTSGRMDAYSPRLIALGLRGMIGKGQRSDEVTEAIKTYGGVYFAAVGGLGALLSKCVTTSEVVAFPDLGTEAIHKLTVKDFPAIVVIDSLGNNLYNIGTNKYRR